MQIEARFHLQKNETLAFKPNVIRLKSVLADLGKIDKNAKDWLLKGNSISEAYLYQVFDGEGLVTKAAEAVLETAQKKSDVRFISVWNGVESFDEAVTASYHFHQPGPIPSDITIEPSRNGIYNLLNLPLAQSLVASFVREFNPSCVSIFPINYFSRQVFKDRPGVGWMLYLPRVLTTQQVPEARALVPVMSGNEKGKQVQTGTGDVPNSVAGLSRWS